MRRTFLLLSVLLIAPVARARAEDPREVTRTHMERLVKEIASFRGSSGRLPTGAEGVESLASDRSLTIDGWGSPILYLRVPGGYALISLGADGQPGGEGEDADLVRLVR